MTLGQRVAVMRDGVVQQVDTPQRLFNEPANLFVAAFIGSPSMNLVEAEVVDGSFHFGGYDLPVPPGVSLSTRRVILGVRPTEFRRGGDADPALPRMRVRADVVEELGAESHVLFRVDAPRVVADAVKAAADSSEDEEALLADDAAAHFTARIEGYEPVAAGAEVELAVDTSRLHFFDPVSGVVLGRR
jgi:multiple sugar transport system ATP-binding protein